jgi:nucleotide-binding universal stress UspA family protein
VDPSQVRLPAYAWCPVIVVRSCAARGRPIVVGVDGSPGSEAALAFGFEEAALRGQGLLAVYGAWEPKAVACAEMGILTDPEDLRATAATLLERTVSPWLERYPYVDARTRTVMRTPKHALLEAAAGAGLLVLGGREPGGVVGLSLGTVASAMLQDAPCSVAVVRPRI